MSDKQKIEQTNANKGNNRVVVEIFGLKYPLKNVNNVDDIVAAAKKIDEQMKAISAKNQYLPPDRVAVLVALMLAEKYIDLKKDYDEIWHILEENRSNKDFK